MRDLLDFVIGLWVTWLALVTGGVLAALLTIWPLFPTTKPASKAIIGSCIAAYFFVSAFIVWKKERRRAEKAEGPFFSERCAELAERIPKMDWYQQNIMKRMAVAGSIKVMDADTEHDVADINMKTDWIHEIPVGSATWAVQLAYLPAMQRYFVDHPIAPTAPTAEKSA